MPVWVLEVAGVAAVKRIVSALQDTRARSRRLCHDGVDFGFRGYVVREAKFGRALRRHADAGILREARSGPERELESRLQIEERHGAILELGADDTFGVQAQPVAVEPQRALEVVNAQGDERDARLHALQVARLQRHRAALERATVARPRPQ